MNILHELPPHFPDNTYIAIDTEIYGMNEKQMHRPISGKFACLTVCADPNTVYFIDNEKDLPEVFSRIENCVWVMQNAKFDLVQLRRWANIPPRIRLIDTMLIERILWNGYYDSFSEAALARRYLNIALDKSLQKSFATATEMTPAMIEYACKDPFVDLQIWNEQKMFMSNTDMKVWRDIDMPCMWAVMDFQGFRLDVERWKALAERNKAKQLELKAQLSFNPNSNPKSVEFYNKNGFKRIPNNQAETLEFFINKYPKTEAARCARLAIDSKKYGTWASRYGMSFITDYLEHESEGVDVIHCNYWITAAESGRMSADDPAMHQIPVRETKEFRECFIARPNQKLVVLDYSQQEVGCMAFLSQDKRLIDIFNSGQDIYIQMAKMLYNKNIEKSDPLRAVMKSVMLGIDYGMSVPGLATKAGITLDEAEETMITFRRKFPTLSDYMDIIMEKKKYVTTASGRKAWLNPYSGQCARNALNSPVQGTAADMLKKSIARMHKEWKFDYPFAIVEVTHDEIGLDVPEGIAQEVADFTERIMVETANEMCPGMKFRVDKHICGSWADAKD